MRKNIGARQKVYKDFWGMLLALSHPDNRAGCPTFWWYKYKKLYSGGTPEFIEGDVFRTVVPLAPIAVEKVGPQDTTQVTTQVATQVTTQVAILAFCKEPRSKAEIMEHCGYKNTKNFTQIHLRPLMESGQLQMTIPDKPRSRNQKYVTVQKAVSEN